MAQVTVDIEEVVAKEIEKRDRKIVKLEKRVAELEGALNRSKDKWAAIQTLRETVVDTAYAIDSYYQED